MDSPKGKHKAHRNLLKKLVNEIEAAVSNDRASLHDLQVLADRLDGITGELKSIDREIAPYLRGSDIEQEFLHVAEYIDKGASYLSKLKYRILQLQPSEEPAPPNLNSTAADTPTSSHSIRLPRLELLKYKGTPRNWPPFWEQFQTVVHKNPALTDVDKFAYLQSSLTGPAAAAIAGLSASSRRHQDARAILTARFAKEDIIVKDHVEHLIDSQPNPSTADVRGLRPLYDDIEANIGGLQALKITEESFSTVLQPIILRSLPRELVLEYYRRGEQINEHPSSSGNDAVGKQTSSASQSSLRSLLDFINREVEARERCESCSVQTDPNMGAKQTEASRSYENLFK
ncbi:uncharacterized protein LOC119391933 [Rhipicephalus sanguineus]|uniref:uncharacterized protein LOC119391933 n=1 Tax=Rhipicephalus sanguineus TaxID=34632 RepID=UPI001895737A|nr:uncharacterized protein LOC119391933 [Rhipicephalus sanguineus]